MSVDHGGAYIFVAEGFLDRPDVAAAFEKIGWEGVAIMAIVSWNGLLDVLPVEFSIVSTNTVSESPPRNNSWSERVPHICRKGTDRLSP